MKRKVALALLVTVTFGLTVIFLPLSEAKHSNSGKNSARTKSDAAALDSMLNALGARKASKIGQGGPSDEPPMTVHSSEATAFAVTPALRDMKSEPLSGEELRAWLQKHEDKEKNELNTAPIRPQVDWSQTGPFTDPTLAYGRSVFGNVVTNPIQNFDGPDMDVGAVLFGGRFAPPDTNAAVGPNHVVITTNSMIQVFSKTGVAAGPAIRISAIMASLPNAADDDGDPIVLYDSLADRWFVLQFNLRFDAQNRMSVHVAVSQTNDPSGTYFAYAFPTNPGRFVDYPHVGLWPDGYYMSSNDFTPPGVAPFLGAGFYTMERAKMLLGDPTAKIIGINSIGANDGGLLPANVQGYAPPPAGTPGLFLEWFADEFGPEGDVLRVFEMVPNYATPLSSTLTQRVPDVALAAFDARNPSGRADIQQPAPGEGLDSIADRFMHAANFRMLPGGVQSFVANFTVNVSGVNPTSSALYQGGIRWMELRRNAGTGVFTVNQDATYAPGSGSGTGRDLWMASVAQDGEGNIGLAANASAPGPAPAALNPTAIYTGRLAGDPVNTLPQGEVDAMSAVTRGVQTATANRWGDYSSLFVDPSDDCTFWAAFEWVDPPSSSFDWNTRIFSFKVNPTCVTSPKGSFSGTITNCNTGLPIQGATVTTTNGFQRTTAANGTYLVSNVAPGGYTVNASKPGAGFNTATGNVTVTNGGNAILNLCLAPSAIIASAGATLVAEGCQPANGVIDPNETVTVSLCVQNTGALNTTNLVGTLQATGGVTSPSGPQNYGVVVAGGPAVCRNFTFTANGSCGGTITASLQMQDGATNLGTVTFTFTLGTLNTAFSQNFDGVTAPNLPAGWVATEAQDVSGLGTPFATSSAGTPAPPADTAPNAVFTNDPNNITDQRLDTPLIAITSASAVLTFRNNFDLESTFDGGVVEISSPNIAAGAFTDITNPAVGGSFTQNGYNSTISSAFGSPISGRQAWSGASGGFVTTVANLGPNVNGQNIRIRFRMAADNSVSDVGWRIDTITITAGFVCCVGAGGSCNQSFDTVTPPALPAGWTAATQIDCTGVPNSDPWVSSSAGNPAPPADSAPNAMFVNDPNCISDEWLYTPFINVTSPTATMSFRRNNNLETGFDGAVLEITVGGAAYQDILAAGGTFGTGGYNGTISVNFGSPIGGRQAWTGNSAGFVTTTVNLPAAANGQTVKFRFRRATDSSVSGQGIRIDTLTFTGVSCNAPSADPGRVGGRIVRPDGTPVGGAVIRLNGAATRTAITDGNGNYEIGDLEVGMFYSVTPELANYSFAPASRSFSLTGNITDAGFTANPDATPSANAIDMTEYFVRQQYLDFLGREPDQGGLDFWSGRINECGSDAACISQRRIDVSAAFFMSREFQDTGSYVYGIYAGTLGRTLSFAEFSTDRAQVLGGAGLDAAKTAFAQDFVQRAEFSSRYPQAMTREQFVDAILATMSQRSGVDHSSLRDGLLGDYDSGGRALVVRHAAEAADFVSAEYNEAFVLFEYFGYLRRTEDAGGYAFWLDVLNRNGGNYRAMVCSFLTSTEYQHRFSPIVTRTNAECQ